MAKDRESPPSIAEIEVRGIVSVHNSQQIQVHASLFYFKVLRYVHRVPPQQI